MAYPSPCPSSAELPVPEFYSSPLTTISAAAIVELSKFDRAMGEYFRWGTVGVDIVDMGETNPSLPGVLSSSSSASSSSLTVRHLGAKIRLWREGGHAAVPTLSEAWLGLHEIEDLRVRLAGGTASGHASAWGGSTSDSNGASGGSVGGGDVAWHRGRACALPSFLDTHLNCLDLLTALSSAHSPLCLTPSALNRSLSHNAGSDSFADSSDPATSSSLYDAAVTTAYRLRQE